ncbi:MAG: ComF family protein [Deferribacteres bacterium]|nr:ComF family protein [candidate division KSB1 bacterium]MCB9512376.1 ComF family protein [Deferribacteres bacterium]
MIAVWQSVKSRVDCLLYPASCLLCEQYHENSMPWLCNTCVNKLLQDCQIHQNIIGKDDHSEHAIDVFSGWAFDDSMRLLIHELKYQKHKQIGAFLGQLIGSRMRVQEPISAKTVFVPVPLHKKRIRERGFNQSEMIATGLASKQKSKVLSKALIRIVHTAQQVHLDRDGRRRNVAGAFACTSKDEIHMSNAHFVLVDDVMTTGATLLECASALRLAGAHKISAVTLAFAQL